MLPTILLLIEVLILSALGVFAWLVLGTESTTKAQGWLAGLAVIFNLLVFLTMIVLIWPLATGHIQIVTN